ncbi:mRNA capping enzyme-domain-containing protein [Coniella lustricola]|uniref:mRNA cap guanine-N(7) methyltransferase n=1 Tax=Coniella lustricola TaxID=2025994 RepID=A0A2T3AM86_9PEZI|nr:mRNA capping enzyme-domain-containing protein [Coniella lustricola]
MAGNDDLPQPYDAKALAPAKKRQRSISPSSSRSPGGANSGSEPARKLKRPGQRSRISESQREELRQRALQREREQKEAETQQQNHEQQYHERAGINDVVRAHYNAVPERGRDWRKTDSKIKGLRAFNNWIKSCIIQKFAPDEDHTPGAMERGITSDKELLVLDLGCGKGGDLGKWQQAPQPVELYVGLDPAEVSIDQARERYRQMVQRDRHSGRGGRGGHYRRPQPRLFEAKFQAKDCFGQSLEDIEIVRQVGFTQSNISNERGFDVVSMMFCLHYAFENEAKARQMLRNVAGSLKKGGRLIGAIPNSDVISEKVSQFNEKQKAKAEKAQANGAKEAESEAQAEAGGSPSENGEIQDDKEEGEAEETAEWGNETYRVRFPGKTPEDGIFRPPFGWKYNFFLHEAVEEVPEYVVPWEAFRALAEDYNLELQYHKSFSDIWKTEKDDPVLGPLSERMGVRERGGGELLVSPEEMEAASFYVGFCFYKV